MRYFAAVAMALCLAAGCGTAAERAVEVAASDPNGPVAEAVATVTTAIFDGAQPAVNAAAASLSPKGQALVQGAYSALEAAVKDAEAVAVKVLVVDPNGDSSAVASSSATSVSDGLKEVQAALDRLIH